MTPSFKEIKRHHESERQAIVIEREYLRHERQRGQSGLWNEKIRENEVPGPRVPPAHAQGLK